VKDRRDKRSTAVVGCILVVSRCRIDGRLVWIRGRVVQGLGISSSILCRLADGALSLNCDAGSLLPYASNFPSSLVLFRDANSIAQSFPEQVGDAHPRSIQSIARASLGIVLRRRQLKV
jgi:hypothetical protein